MLINNKSVNKGSFEHLLLTFSPNFPTIKTDYRNKTENMGHMQVKHTINMQNSPNTHQIRLENLTENTKVAKVIQSTTKMKKILYNTQNEDYENKNNIGNSHKFSVILKDKYFWYDMIK